MPVLSKTYNIAAGILKFDFTYSGIVTASLDDLDIVEIGELNYGYDNDNSIGLSIYPSNIDITVDDLTGDNYTKFKALIEGYSLSYPYNHDAVFNLKIYLNGQIIFKGILDELESDKDSWELTLKFVDGINKYKDVNIGNPYVLQKLWDNNVIFGARLNTTGTVGYGFGTMSYIEYGGDPSRSGYFVNDIQSGDRDTKLEHTIVQLFKLLNVDISVDFDIQYLFRDIIYGSETVNISRVYIRRILSNLLGRYVVIEKHRYPSDVIAYLNGNPDYTREQYFQVVYEDDLYKTYKHSFSGAVGSLKWEKGTDDKTIGELLKTLAYNFFTYFGFKNIDEVFFRHRRYLSSSVELTDIISMNKILDADKVEKVIINDYYSGNYASKGVNYGGSDSREILYKIPLNAFRTANSYEYRLNYFQGGHEKRVIHFIDVQSGYEDIPQEVISNAEWNAHKNFRDKYEFKLSGIDYNFDETYSVDQFNYQGKFRPLEISKNLFENKTSMKAIQID